MSTKKKNERVFETPQEEINFLKRQVAGLKGQISTISKEKEKWKDYGKEADELNEKRIAQIDDLKATLCGKDKTINGLESQVNTLSEQLAETERVAKTRFEYIKNFKSLPWYKRIFFKG